MALVQHGALILASGSAIRQQMLKSAGLTFSVEPSGVDEDAIKQTLPQDDMPALGLALARAKTLSVSAKYPHAYTIGADQLCVHAGTILSKPGSYARAEAQLALLARSTHQQISGVVLARGSEVLWEYSGTATLTMRDLTPAEISAYVAADAPLQSCGAYKFEALGRHLFSTVDGDHDVIQGLALVPLLAQLHKIGAIHLATAA